MSRLALSSIKNRGEGSWALCTSFLIPDTLRLHTPNAYNNPFSPPPIKNPKSASEQSHPIMGSKRLALPSNQCCPGSNPCVDAMCGWVCGWFSPLLRKLSVRVLGFSPLLKNQHFHFQIGCSTSKSLFIIIIFFYTSNWPHLLNMRKGLSFPNCSLPAMQGHVRKPQIRAPNHSLETEGCQHDLKSIRHVSQLTSLAR